MSLATHTPTQSLLPTQTPSIPKLLNDLSSILSAQNTPNSPPPFISIVQVILAIQKHFDDEVHMGMLMQYYNAIIANILLRDESTHAEQWQLVKSHVFALLGDAFETQEMDSEERMDVKRGYLRDMIEKEGFLEILGRIIPDAEVGVDGEDGSADGDEERGADAVNGSANNPSTTNPNHPDSSPLDSLFEDRKRLYGILKLLHAMTQLLGVKFLTSHLLKQRKIIAPTRKHTDSMAPPTIPLSPRYTYAYRIISFLLHATLDIHTTTCSTLTDLEKADIFLYTSELYATLTQESPEIRKLLPKHCTTFLRLIEHYISHSKPKIANELEGFSHMMDALSAHLTEPANQAHFTQLNLSAISLLVRLIKSHKFAREPGIRALLYALTDNPGALQMFLHQQQGLGLLFPLFMKPLSKKGTENIIELLAQIVNLNDATIHMRFIQKFKEKSFEKTDRLVSIFLEYYDALQQFEEEIKSGKYVELLIEVEGIRDESELEERILTDRLKNGLYMMRLIAKVIAYVCEAEVRERVLLHLRPRKMGLEDVAEVLEEYIDFLGEDEEVEGYRCGVLVKFLRGEAVEG